MNAITGMEHAQGHAIPGNLLIDSAHKIIFGGDIELYREGANILRTAVDDVISTNGLYALNVDTQTLPLVARNAPGQIQIVAHITGAAVIANSTFDIVVTPRFKAQGHTNYMTLTKAADAGARVMTFPDVSDTVVTLAATQELTAKTLTAPVIVFANNIPLQWKNAAAAVRDILWYDNSGSTRLNSPDGTLLINYGVSTDIALWVGSGTGRNLTFAGTPALVGEQLKDSPTVTLAAYHWVAAATVRNATFLHSMVTAGVTPKSYMLAKIDGVQALSWGNNNGAAMVGFYATTPIVLQTGVAVTAEGIHAALVNLGLITA